MAAIPADRYPPLNSLRLIPANDVLPDGCNTWAFDRGFFYQQIRTFFQQKTNYAQKIAGGDVLGIYLDSVADHILVNIIDCNNKVIYSFFGGSSRGGTVITTANKDTRYGQQYFTYFFTFDPTAIGIPDGFYFITVEHMYYPSPDARNTVQVSECFHFKQAGWPKTMLFKYTHGINDYDIFFETIGPVIPYFQFRIEAAIPDPDPASHDISFENMNYQLTPLQSVPYRVFELIVGGNAGVPPWVIDKINRIFCCNEFYIDNVQYRKETNAQWAKKKADGYPKKAATISLREADNTAGWEYYTPFPVPEFRIHDDTFDDTHD